MKKFWNWTNQAPTETEPEQRILTLNGTIAEESWFDDDITPQLFREELNAAAGDLVDIIYKDPDWTVEEYRAALKNAHIIIGEPRNEDFVYCEHLELMHSPSSGVNYYLDGGKFPKGAILCCMTGGYGNVLAEHMLGLTLSLCRRLPEYHDQQKEHLWQLRKYDKQLEDCTLLILGAGDIGTTR